MRTVLKNGEKGVLRILEDPCWVGGRDVGELQIRTTLKMAKKCQNVQNNY
jgi:hypothetical protein